MSRSPSLLAALLAALMASAADAQTAAGDAPRYGFGRPASAQEIAAWDIDVRPDGHGVRKGNGTVAQGQRIFDAQCASCHGTFGESNRYMAIAGGVKPEDLKSGRASELSKPDGLRTLGTKLNSAATLWDYINRAMPWTNPQSLTVDEVYAVTAYVLHLNGIVPAAFELSDGNLTRVAMPNRNGMTTQHGMASINGTPDVQGSDCMKDCAQSVAITSSLPEFARNQHGNLAEQKRALGPYRGIDTAKYDPAGKAGRRRWLSSPLRRAGRRQESHRCERLHCVPCGRQHDRGPGLPRGWRQVPGPPRCRDLPRAQDSRGRAGDVGRGADAAAGRAQGRGRPGDRSVDPRRCAVTSDGIIEMSIRRRT